MTNDQVAALIDGLRDSSSYVRYDSAYRLSKVGYEARKAVRSLIKTVEEDDEWVSSWSAYALGRVRPIAEEAIPVLIRRIGDKNDRIGFACGEALETMGPVTVPFLLDALKNGNEWARMRSASALCSIRPVSVEAISALINALADECEQVRNSSANALGYVGQPALVALISALQRENEWVRAKSAYAIGRMGLEAKDAVPALVSAQRDKSRRVRSKSARALNRIRALQEEEQEHRRGERNDSSEPKPDADAIDTVGPQNEQGVLQIILARLRAASRVLVGARPAELSFDEVDNRIAEWCAAVATDKITGLFVPEADDLDAYDHVHREITRFVFEAIREYASHEAKHGPIWPRGTAAEPPLSDRQ